MIETPTDVAAFLAKRQIPHARAKRKLADVLARAATGVPPVDLIREIWTFGSFARGALAVGDVDLYMLVDESRTPQQFALDTYYARAQPFSEQIKALGCGGSSLVSIQAHPVFDPAAEPASPERLTFTTASGESTEGLIPTAEPALRHAVTSEQLAGPFVLLWARGDDKVWAIKRLEAITENPEAARYERTTTVPLIDDLVPKLGLATSFELAMQLREGNIGCRALLLQPAEAPEQAMRALRRRYRRPGEITLLPRAAAAGAALRHLSDEGVDLRDVELVDGPVTANPKRVKVFVTFNPFFIYKAAGGDFRSGFRLLHVWPSGRRGPWLAFEVTVLDSDRANELSWSVHHPYDGSTRADRGGAILKILNAEPHPTEVA